MPSIMSAGAEKRGEIFVGWTFVWVCRMKVLQLKESIGNEPDRNRSRLET